MDRISIVGGKPLHGAIPISGAKNATLPLMIASLLTKDTLILDNVPRLADVSQLQRILNNHGVDIMVNGKRPGDTAYQGQTLHISAANIVDTTAPYELVSKMRASFWVIGPLVARMGEAKVSMPGGCAIGTRPVDLLIMALQGLGAEIEIDGGYVIARARNGLRGGEIVFPKVTVGGTHTALMAASLAHGTSVIENAAREPEIVALADFLNAAGARISGQGSTEITAQGVAFLRPVEFENIPDRIEAGTYLAAAAITGGNVTLRKVRPDHLSLVLDRLREMGVGIAVEGNAITVTPPASGRLRAIDVTTQPYPGFPTDLQAQFMALLCVAEGSGVITDTIYTDRFAHVPELQRLGAEIRLRLNVASVRGRERLQGASVTSTDIRASSALVLAGLVARGETLVHRVYHIDRGYEAIEKRLRSLGAEITRFSAPGP